MPSFVLAYHGCEKDTLERVLSGQRLRPSNNKHDWLGSGCYFWEHNHQRAYDWARKRFEGKAAVLGALINLGNCLNLLDSRGLAVVRSGYDSLERLLNKALPANGPSNDPDKPNRKLDCAVLTHLLEMSDETGTLFPFDTVRAVFQEGKDLYPGAGFREQNHIQVCVRNPIAIKVFFRVPFRSECCEDTCGPCGLVCIED